MALKTENLKRGLVAVLGGWLLTGSYLGWHDRWDVVAAMIISYAIGGAVTGAFNEDLDAVERAATASTRDGAEP